jgi:hypothetical protein
LDGDGEGGVSSQRVQQVIDIILFNIPDDCRANSWGGCDWSSLGMGAPDDGMEGGVSYCCAEDTAARGICDPDNVGRLIVKHNLFVGDHRTVDVPTSGDTKFLLGDPIFKVKVTGDYVMVLGNCDDYGMEVLAIGSMEWTSVGGYLPGEMFGLMFFYAILTAIYFVLVLWYWCGMKMYQDAAIPIQKFIITTMILGLLELTLRTLDLRLWNLKGVRSDGLVYACKLIHYNVISQNESGFLYLSTRRF